MSGRKTQPVAARSRLMFQVRSSWAGWVALTEPLEERGEAYDEYRAACEAGGMGWTSQGGREIAGPRVGLVVELVEFNPTVSGERIVERSDRPPTRPGDLGAPAAPVAPKADVETLLDAMGQRLEELDLRCTACGEVARDARFTPGGEPFCPRCLPRGTL